MFKRIHSNRDPSQTIWRSLYQEFGHYAKRFGISFGRLCVNYPKTLFGAMIGLLLLSGILSFTIFRRPGPGGASLAAAPQQKRRPLKSLHPLDEGFSRILQTGGALKQTLTLKQELEAMLAKGRLTPNDSLRLEQALDSLAILQHQIH